MIYCVACPCTQDSIAYLIGLIYIFSSSWVFMPVVLLMVNGFPPGKYLLQPFRPPMLMPLMAYFSPTRNSASVGSKLMVSAANSAPQSVAYLATS